MEGGTQGQQQHQQEQVPLPPPPPPSSSFPRVSDVLREELDVWFSYPSVPQEPGQPPDFHRSTRVLLYDRDAKLPQDSEGNPIPDADDVDALRHTEVVIKGIDCPDPLMKERVLHILGQLYKKCAVVDVPPKHSERTRLWSKLPCSMLPNHQGILPMLGIFSTPERLYLATEYQPYTLLALMRFNSPSLESSMLGRAPREALADLRSRFLFYQLLHLISFVHSRGQAVGEISPRSILVSNDMLWLHTVPCVSPLTLTATTDPETGNLESSQGPPRDNAATSIPKPPGFGTPLTLRWLNGQISNLEYLMEINMAAGRSMIDASFHPVLPWVSDLTVQNGGWRDLTKSKFRLNKGDAQLDSTYMHYIHTSQQHHIPESLSEITFYIYTARRTPLKILQTVVRADFVPQHYPSSVQRMYEWTPDECIPEFFTDPTVFSSLHKDIGMVDISFPSWCSSASNFITYHRSLLESEHVSRKLHHWIDLNFGYCLDGQAAVDNKNVPLKVEASLLAQGLVKNPGFVQLFREPHPQRAERTGTDVRTNSPSRTPPREGLHSKFLRAHEGIDASNAIHASDVELLRRAPTIPLDESGVFAFVTCHENVDRIQSAHTFSKSVDKRLSPCYYPCAKITEEPTESLYRLQKEDMFAAGCILAELYLGVPLFSTASLVGSAQPQKYRRLLPEEMNELPVPIRAAVQWLVHDDYWCRPSARELIRLNRGPGSSYWRDDQDYDDVDQLDSSNVSSGLASKNGYPRDPKLALLRKACHSLFPDYFSELYNYLSSVQEHRQQNEIAKELVLTMSSVRPFSELPLPAFSLVLPFMLRVLNDPAPLEETDKVQTEASPQKQVPSKLLEIISFVDQLAKKVGPRYTQRLIFPRMVSFIDKIQSLRALESILISRLWSILITRGSAVSFIITFSPLLTRMLRDPRLGVPQIAVQALTNTSCGLYESLGPGLLSRYVIPQVLDTVGILKAEDGSEVPSSEGLYHVHALTTLCRLVDDDIVARLATEHLMNDTLLVLEPLLLPEPKERVCQALLEILVALEGLLPALSDSSVLYHYCRQPTLSIQTLLLTIPLPPLPGSSPSSSSIDEQTPLQPNSIRHRIHVQLGRLVGQVCLYIGPEATKELVLPFMDKFFSYFTDTYHELDGVEAGSELHYMKQAALEMVDDMWRSLTFLYSDAELQRLIPNGWRLVAIWFEKSKEEGGTKDVDRRLSGGSTGSSGAREYNSHGRTRRSVTPSGERDRWPDVVGHHLEKGLNWLAKQHRHHRDHSSGSTPVTPYSWNERGQAAHATATWQSRALTSEESGEFDRISSAEGAIPPERSPASMSTAYGPLSSYSREHILAERWSGGLGEESSGLMSGFTSAPDDWQDGMELQELADQRPRLKSREVAHEGSRRASPAPHLPSHTSSEESAKETHHIHRPLGGPVRRTHSAGPIPSGSLTVQSGSAMPKGGSLSPTRLGAGAGLGREVKSATVEQSVSDQSDEEATGYESEGESVPWDGYAYANEEADYSVSGAAPTPGGLRDLPHPPDAPYQRSPTSNKRDFIPGKHPGLSSLVIPPPHQSSAPSSTSSSSRAKRESWFSVHAGSVDEKRRREHLWLFGSSVENPVLSTKALYQAGCAWPFRLCSSTSIEAFKPGVTVRSLAVDLGERLLLTGSRRGSIRMWSLRSHPVSTLASYEQHTECILSMAFCEGSERVVSLDAGGCLLLWDVNTRDTLARRERAAEGGLAYMPYVAFDLLSGWNGVSPALDTCSSSCQQILAATPTTLYHFDMREKQSTGGTGGSTVVQVHKSSEWFVSSGSFLEPSEMGLHRGVGGLVCLTSHEDGNWICTGSSNGQLCVLDKRTGTIRHNWQGHENAVIKLAAWNRHQVVSVSLDRTAVLWDLRGSPYPIRVSILRGLPDSPPGINMSTVLTHDFRRSPSSIKKQPLLLAFAGYKGCFAAMPPDGMEERAKLRGFQAGFGPRPMKQKVNIQSVTILPLRQLLLLGCEDGLVRVCT